MLNQQIQRRDGCSHIRIATTIVSLAIVCSTASAAHAQAGPRRVALIIGNVQYEDEAHFQRLDSVADDVRDIASSLKSAGVTVVGDGPLLNLTKAGFQTAVANFIANATSNDTLLLYFGGHGIQYAGTNYLIPVNAHLDTIDDVVVDGINVDRDILQSLGAHPHGASLVVLDACQTSFAGTTGLARPALLPLDTVLFTAASPGYTASANSAFASSFAGHITEPGVSVDEVIKFVTSDVLLRTHNAQQPQPYGTFRQPVFLVDPVFVNVVLAPADDDSKVLYNGVVVTSWLTSQGQSARIRLATGPNLFDIRVYNQRTFTGGIEGLGGHLPEGWHYGISVTDDKGKVLVRLNDAEDRPAADGPRHGKEFLAGRFQLVLDKKTRAITVSEATNRVW